MTKALPPLTAMDRMGSGEHLGQCPTCGGLRWWDNRARKRAGEAPPDSDDYRCTACGHRRWEAGREEAGRGGNRGVAVRTTVVDTVMPAARGRCAATTKAGQPCGGMAMAGAPYCGPHSGAGRATTGARTDAPRCLGTTKAGQPCGAGPMRGTQWCPQHQPDTDASPP